MGVVFSLRKLRGAVSVFCWSWEMWPVERGMGLVSGEAAGRDT